MSFGNISSTYMKCCSIKPFSICQDMVDIEVTENFKLEWVNDRMIGTLITAIQTGALGSIGGKAAYIYHMVTDKFRLPPTYVAPNKYMLLAKRWERNGEPYDTLMAHYKLSKSQTNSAYVPIPEFVTASDIQNKEVSAYDGCRIPLDRIREIIKPVYNDMYAAEIQAAQEALEKKAVLSFTNEVWL